MALQLLNRSADSISNEALEINARAAISLKDILKTNLGPKGKMKMLVNGSGDITLTKDGCVLLKNMQIEHPTASLIARNAAAQDDITGDGSTSLVVFIGELLLQAMHHINDGVHPRLISEGVEMARVKALDYLKDFATDVKDIEDRELLCNVALCSLQTKIPMDQAKHMAPIVVDAVKAIKNEGPVDLYMVELMTMEHKSALNSELVKGLVLDHGFRHPEMPKQSKNCYLLICNVSLEYEKTEVNSQFCFKDSLEKEKMVSAERSHVNDLLFSIINLKNKVSKTDKDCSFVVINQKGIDPLSLDFLHKSGIVALRRAKRRNMERLTLAFGGCAVNSFEGLTPNILGYAESVVEHTLGEERYTFITGAKEPRSVTILLRGPNSYTINRLKDSVRDGLRAVKSAIEVRKLVAGGGAFEVSCHIHLNELIAKGEFGKMTAGAISFADALLSIPKALATNAGLDAVEAVRSLKEATIKGEKVGLRLDAEGMMNPEDEGVWDNFLAKLQLLHLGAITAENLLVVDEIIRAGKVEKRQ